MENQDIGLDRMVLLQTRVHRTLRTHLKPVLKQNQIDINNWIVLLVVQKLGKKGISVADVAETAAIRLSQASTALSELVEKEFVKRRQDTIDHRKQIIFISARGNAKLEDIQQQLTQLSDGYSVAQTATFVMLANKIISDLNDGS